MRQSHSTHNPLAHSATKVESEWNNGANGDTDRLPADQVRPTNQRGYALLYVVAILHLIIYNFPLSHLKFTHLSHYYMSMELTLPHNTFSSSYTKAPSALTESTFVLWHGFSIRNKHNQWSPFAPVYHHRLSGASGRLTAHSASATPALVPPHPALFHDGGPPSAPGLTRHTMTFFLQCFPSCYTAVLCPVSMAPQHQQAAGCRPLSWALSSVHCPSGHSSSAWAPHYQCFQGSVRFLGSFLF